MGVILNPEPLAGSRKKSFNTKKPRDLLRGKSSVEVMLFSFINWSGAVHFHIQRPGHLSSYAMKGFG